ncbi:MAG TPA: DNA polymerase/3'-5' exonuclease PolX [Gemmatimonadales bacterium]|nr:DNA polymerase/3'-5' exonuclease PolX [Gemmatimonadales bacterium]
MENAEIALALSRVGTLLEIQGANPFRVRAYENAARTVAEHPVPLHAMIAEGADLQDLPGIGKDMAGYITELVTTGRLTLLDQLTREVPATLIDLVRLPGVGPKRARKLWQELGVETLDQLRQAARAGRVETLEGFGKKTQARILEAITGLAAKPRVRLAEAEQFVVPLVAHLRRHPGVARVDVAGSYRRRLETVGDIDVLVISDDAPGVMAHFTTFPRTRSVEAAGGTRATIVLEAGLQVDLRILPERSFGAALLYFTGSKAHNVKLRKRAVGMGLSISEYGVTRVPEGAPQPETAAGSFIAGATEEEVYASVGLPWIQPELREDRGEIEAAERNALPHRLIGLEDIRGDLQMHSTWSDGKQSVAHMLDACAARGYEYCAITDHSKALAMVRGLDAGRLAQQWEEMDRVTADRTDITLLRSMEVDILRDGSLDLEDELLERLDVVVVSIHSLMELPADQQTRRIVRALEHPHVTVLAHPTGRLINRRNPMTFDLDDVLHCAAEHGVAVELNAQPDRLDLRDTQIARARELGVKVVISTDAHHERELDFMRYGVEQARRAWLEPGHVLNTLPLREFLPAIKSPRGAAS